jgi:murein DD-endopeptidase MepM/ murein hydrolase activator NlpD
MLNDIHPPRQNRTHQPRPWIRYRRIFLFALLAAGCFCAGLWSITPEPSDDGPPVAAQPVPSPQPKIERKTVKGYIQPGDTITALLGRFFSPRQILTLSQVSKEVFPLSRLCAGQAYELCLVGDRFDRFVYDIDREEQLVIRRLEDDFDIHKVPIAYTVHPERVNASIQSSLFEAVLATGENETLAINLADIFAWDVDFIRDIRPGDSFEALVEKRFRDGRPAGYGRILAARFTNRGQSYQAYLFQDGDHPPAYYDENGHSVRKAFLKAPLSFTRISSGFTMRRLHPITKKIKPHPAIDYAAPIGTPIKTVADGSIVTASYNKYNGKYVKIRHPGGWITMYNHMNAFKRGIRRGKKIRQGQVIGYVGTTGLSTGPHLDFRMYKNGRAVNPLKVKSPPAEPVSARNRAAFNTAVTQLAANLSPPGLAGAARIAAGPPAISGTPETLSN